MSFRDSLLDAEAGPSGGRSLLEPDEQMRGFSEEYIIEEEQDGEEEVEESSWTSLKRAVEVRDTKKVLNVLTDRFVVVVVVSQLVLMLLLSVAYIEYDARERGDDPSFAPGQWLVAVLAACMQIGCYCVILNAFARVYHILKTKTGLYFILQLYLCVVLFFAGSYVVIYAIAGSTCFSDAHTSSGVSYGNAFYVWSHMLYFSMCTVSSAGLGDIAPVCVVSELVTQLEICHSMMFNYGLVSLAVQVWVTGSGNEAQQEAMVRRSSQLVSLGGAASLAASVRGERGCVSRVYRGWDAMKRLLARISHRFLPFTLGFQAISLVLLYLSGATDRLSNTTWIGFTCLLLQTVQVAFVLAGSLQIITRIEGRRLSAGFFARSYIAIVLLFAGMHFTVDLLGSGEYYEGDFEEEWEEVGVIRGYMRYVYFSFVTQSLTGFGDISPAMVISRLLVCVQLAVATLYCFVIIGAALAHFAKHRDVDVPPEDEEKSGILQ